MFTSSESLHRLSADVFAGFAKSCRVVLGLTESDKGFRGPLFEVWGCRVGKEQSIRQKAKLIFRAYPWARSLPSRARRTKPKHHRGQSQRIRGQGPQMAGPSLPTRPLDIRKGLAFSRGGRGCYGRSKFGIFFFFR